MEDLTFGEQVKIILSRKGMTIKELAELIEAATGKKMSRQNLTQRLGRDNFQEQDMRMIAAILGCPFQLSIFPLENETGQRAEPMEELLLKYVKHPRVQPRRKKADLEDGVYQQVLVFDQEKPEEAVDTGKKEVTDAASGTARKESAEGADPEKITAASDTDRKQPPEDSGMDRKQPPEDSGTLRAQPSEDSDTDRKQPSEDPGMDRKQPPEDPDTLRAQPSEDPGTDRKQPSEDLGTGRKQPSEDSDTARTQPSEDPGTGREQPPEDSDMARTQPSEDSGTARTQPSEGSDTARKQPPEDSDTFRTQPAEEMDTGKEEDLLDLDVLDPEDSEDLDESEISDGAYHTKRLDRMEILSAAMNKEENHPVSGTEEPEEEKETPAAEERDMTIGELYMIHKELDQLEETIHPGQAMSTKAPLPAAPDPVPEIKQERVEAEPEPEDFEPVIRYEDAEENLELGEMNPYTGREYQTNSVRMHPSRIGYVQVYDRFQHGWTDMTEWAFLGYQERKKTLLGRDYEPPIYLD